jgi:hypothetical protein
MNSTNAFSLSSTHGVGGRSTRAWVVATAGVVIALAGWLMASPWWWAAALSTVVLCTIDGEDGVVWFGRALHALGHSATQWRSVYTGEEQIIASRHHQRRASLWATAAVGRRDLQREPDDLVHRLVALMTQRASGEGGHLSVHGTTPAEPLYVAGPVAPIGFRRVPVTATGEWRLVRWRYVRTPRGVVRAFAVRDLSRAPSTWLGDLLAGTDLQYAVHLHFARHDTARREAARRAHRSDVRLSMRQLVGGRISAQALALRQQAHEDERAVAQGATLVEVGVLLGVAAATRGELLERSRALLARATQCGVVLSRGAGAQGRWTLALEPGGPSW